MRWVNVFVLALGLGLALPSIAAAQGNPTLTEARNGIRDDDPAATPQLRIAEIRVSARVAGRTADVTLDMLIRSDSGVPYEGNLALALPADAVVTGYALNVGEAMIPGQLLEQPRARNVYEDEVRRGIDPGLAEVSAGNRFTTRIFPITTSNPRRFRVQFAAPFDPATGLTLPLSRDAAIDALALDVRIEGYLEQPPSVTFAGERVSLERDGAGWRGAAEKTRSPLRDGLAIGGGTPDAITVTTHASGERFFVIADRSGDAPAAPRPGRLRVYWDRSLSHGRDKVELEAEVLSRLADATVPTAIDLVTFASDAPQVSSFAGVAELREALRAVTYRGGTSLAGLEGLALQPASQCVLVFDGQITIDRDAEFAPDCPLALLTSSTEADGARLAAIAQRTGARVVRVAEDGGAEAARTLARPGAAVVSVRDSAGRRLPFRALPAAPDGWLLVGPMPDRGGVQVRLADGSERTYASGQPGARFDAPGALWAAQQVRVLGDDPTRHEAMAEMARRYQVASPEMSFLVMETAEQYLAAELAPPAGFSKQWMAEYEAAKRAADEEAADARSERLERVLAEWKRRRDWWQRPFDKRRAARDDDESSDEAAAEEAVDAVPLSAPPPPPPPPPSPAQSPDGSQGYGGAPDDGSAAIMVTGSRIERQNLSSNSPIITVDAELLEQSSSSALERSRAGESEARPTGRAIALELADQIGDNPYIAALEAAAPADRLKVLAEQERAYGSLPVFYLDVAEWFRLKGDAATADLLLLSALELPLSDDETRQVIAFRLERDRSFARAVELAELMAASNAGFLPQPVRQLALALAARGKSRGRAGRADLERAFTLLTGAALDPAERDFDGFEVIALADANALIPAIEAAGGTWSLDRRLVDLLDTDVRIVIEWTVDDADIDLWVDEPGGERVIYSNPLSRAGGMLSNDMTDGYGPEEYVIRRAPDGAYEVRINGYDADRINPNGQGRVLVRLQRNFARSGGEDVLIDADLAFQEGSNRNASGGTQPVATLRVGK